MTSEHTPSPVKRLERQSLARLEGFAELNADEIRKLPPAALEGLDRFGIISVIDTNVHDDFKTQVLTRIDPDGVQQVLASVLFDKGQKISGAILQLTEGELIGRTTFTNHAFGDRTVLYVGSTNTWAKQREGLGEERLRIINEYTKMKFGMPLCSSADPSDSATALWESLLRRGLAEKRSLEDGTMIYSML